MKKFKLVSLIILMSMVFSTLIPLKVRAVDTNKIITAKNFNAFYLLTIVAHAGAGNLSVEEFNTAAKNHFVDIDELSKTETVIKYSGEKFPEFSNDILDTTDVYLADQYTAFFFAGEMDSSVLKDLNDWVIKKKADLGISEEITKFSTEIEIIGKNGTKLSSTISKDGGTALLGEKKDFKNESDVKEALAKLGINMVNVPEQVDIIGNGKLFDVGSKMTPVEQFYYNLGINDAAVLWKLNVNDKSFYMVYGYEKTNSGKYNCNVYLVTDKTLDPVPDDNKFETELNYEAFIGTKDVGGKTEDGTFMPSYDETNIKEDADVTATISSKNKEEIVKVNDKEVTDTPSKDQPWYYPNPEDKKAFKLALELGEKVDADLVLATDPDADRLGVFAKDNVTGKYMEYTGNMSALLIAEYRISQMKEKGILPKDGMLITTIVSSNLAKAIAKEYGLECIEVLTGFKNIGAVMKKAEEEKNKTYIFGFEESYGCLIGDYARDKDAIAAVMALCEAACYYKTQGKTLWDQMQEIYKKYGYYKETQVSIVLEGSEGAEKIKQIMNDMRSASPEKIGSAKVLKFKDFDRDVQKDLVTGETTTTGLSKSNVLYYELEDDGWCCIRPSGTEPKIKLYIGVKDESEEKAINKMEESKEELSKIIK